MRRAKIISMLLIFIICLTNISTALEIEGQIEDIESPAIVTEDNIDSIDEKLIIDDESLIIDNQNEFINVKDIEELKTV